MIVFTAKSMKFIKHFSANGLLRLVLGVLLLVVPHITGISAQNMDSLRVSVDFEQVKLSQALDYLYDHYQLNIAFSKPDDTQDAVVSFKASEQTVEQVLDGLMSNTVFTFRKMGSQYVVFKKGDSAQTTNSSEPEDLSKPDVAVVGSIPDTIVKYKTRYQIDTLIHTDTITRVDTVVVFDTVTIFKEKAAEGKGRIKALRTDIFDQDARRRQGFAVHLYYGGLLSWIDNMSSDESSTELATIWDRAEATSFRSKTAGLNMVFNQPKFCVNAGISYTDISHRFQYSKIDLIGGNFLVDTLDAYYAISGIDTTWFYVTDSAYVPLSERRFDFLDMNHFGILEVQLGLGYTFLQFPGVRVYAKGGVGLGFLINYSGSAIANDEKQLAVSAEDVEAESFRLSFNAGIGGRFRISDAFDLVPEINYLSYPGSVLKDYPVKRQVSAVSFRIGLMYYF